MNEPTEPVGFIGLDDSAIHNLPAACMPLMPIELADLEPAPPILISPEPDSVRLARVAAQVREQGGEVMVIKADNATELTATNQPTKIGKARAAFRMMTAALSKLMNASKAARRAARAEGILQYGSPGKTPAQISRRRRGRAARAARKITNFKTSKRRCKLHGQLTQAHYSDGGFSGHHR